MRGWYVPNDDAIFADHLVVLVASIILVSFPSKYHTRFAGRELVEQQTTLDLRRNHLGLRKYCTRFAA